jgi:hypothetical protein
MVVRAKPNNKEEKMEGISRSVRFVLQAFLLIGLVGAVGSCINSNEDPGTVANIDTGGDTGGGGSIDTGGDTGGGGSSDTTPPTFAGLESAGVLNATTAKLSWSAAIDNASPASGIRYFIYFATSSGGQIFSSPQFITTPGVTTYEVSGLSPGQAYYFVVKAVDTSDNADFNTIEKAVALVEWQDATGSDTPVSLNLETTQGSADEPSLAFNSGQIYAAWVEKNGPAGANQTYTGSLNGTSWVLEGSLNVDPLQSSKEATVAFDVAGQQYVAWSEYDTTNGDVYVKRKNGASWGLLGGSLTISDPGLSPIATIGHSPAVIPVTAHTAFVQKNNVDTGIEQLFVKRWNEGTGVWELLGGGLNVDPGKWAGLPVLAYLDTVPYVVWGEGPLKDLYVKRWNGATWELVGGKLNSREASHHPWIAGHSQTVYVSWVEQNASGVFQAYVAQWNETISTWSKLGGSLNLDTDHEAKSARVAVSADGTVYSAWTEIDDLGKYQLYVRRWNGTSWILEGGSLNVDVSRSVTEPHIAVNGNAPYATWVENNGGENGQVYVLALP